MVSEDANRTIPREELESPKCPKCGKRMYVGYIGEGTRTYFCCGRACNGVKTIGRKT